MIWGEQGKGNGTRLDSTASPLLSQRGEAPIAHYLYFLPLSPFYFSHLAADK